VRKAVHNWVEKFSKGLSKAEHDARPGAKVVEITVKRLLCCAFRRTDKEIGQVYQCCWRSCREINVFSKSEFNMFYVLYPFVTCLLTFPRTNK
jgi:hypothetical protein